MLVLLSSTRPHSAAPGFVVLAQLLLAGCEIIHGSGDVIKEKRSIDAFDELVLQGDGEVRFTQADEQRLVVEAEDNLVDELVTEVSGDTLVIKTRDHVILDPTKPILFHVEAPDLQAVKIQGAAAFRSDELQTDKLEVEISGSGVLRIDELDAQSVLVDISGSGSVRLAGNVQAQEVDISGSGEYLTRDLKSQRAKVDVSGSGEVEVFATDILAVEISGSGDVAVRGKPETNVDISGSGDVTSLN